MESYLLKCKGDIIIAVEREILKRERERERPTIPRPNKPYIEEGVSR